MSLRLTLLFLLVCACRKSAPTPGDAEAATPPVSSTVLLPSAPSAPSATPHTEPPTIPTKVEDRKPPPGDDPERPMVRAGPRVFWAEDDGDASLVLGAFGGVTRLIRRTSGKVGAIDVLEGESDLTIVWASDLGAGKGQLVALARASHTLDHVSAPTTVAIVASQIAQVGHVEVRKNPRGGVLVVHEGAIARCEMPNWPPDTDCLTFEVKAVRTDDKIERLGGGKLLGGPSPAYSSLDVDGRALVVLATSMRGGLSSASISVGYSAAEAPPGITPPNCGGLPTHVPELMRGSDGEVVALCVGYADKNARCARSLGHTGDQCLNVSVTGRDGKPRIASGSATVTRIECDNAHVRLTFPGGVVTLDSPSRLTSEFAKCAR